MDAAAQAAHQPGPGGLAEVVWSRCGVDTDQPQRGPVPAQRPDDTGAVPAGTHTAHQDVQVVYLSGGVRAASEA
ncbi:hypothetical protein GCM10023238_06580 [Streptomyces heliomycini]